MIFRDVGAVPFLIFGHKMAWPLYFNHFLDASVNSLVRFQQSYKKVLQSIPICYHNMIYSSMTIFPWWNLHHFLTSPPCNLQFLLILLSRIFMDVQWINTRPLSHKDKPNASIISEYMIHLKISELINSRMWSTVVFNLFEDLQKGDEKCHCRQ